MRWVAAGCLTLVFGATMAALDVEGTGYLVDCCTSFGGGILATMAVMGGTRYLRDRQ